MKLYESETVLQFCGAGRKVGVTRGVRQGRIVQGISMTTLAMKLGKYKNQRISLCRRRYSDCYSSVGLQANLNNFDTNLGKFSLMLTKRGEVGGCFDYALQQIEDLSEK